MVELYSYFRSSAAYRVRIALNIKQIPYAYKSVHLVRNGGEQHADSYVRLNPSELVPTLVDGDIVLTQSMAIMEYLEEAYPDRIALLPSGTKERAQARALAQLIASDIHPLNNLRVLNYLNQELNSDKSEVDEWYANWIHTGFGALEKLLADSSGEFCVGDKPTIADCCLIPQVYNAYRYKLDLSDYPNILRIYQQCKSMSAFEQAQPENQPDAA